MNERRVVITGIGVVSPVGNDLATFWESLKAGRSGIGPITAFDTTKFDCQIAGEVRGFDPTPFTPRRKMCAARIATRNSRWVRPRWRWRMGAMTCPPSILTGWV